YVRTEALATHDEAFFVHNLHLLERGGVGAAFSERSVNFTHRGGAEAPEGRQDVQFSTRGKRCRAFAGASFRRHLQRSYYDITRMSTRFVVQPAGRKIIGLGSNKGACKSLLTA